MIKRVLSLLFAVIFIISSNATMVRAEDATSVDMNKLDVLIAASIYLNSNQPNEDLLTEGSGYRELVPLYDLQDDVVAYYVSFTPSGYAVINNNIQNPTPIEFGDGDNDFIREILITISQPHIIYNNPYDIYNRNIYSQYRINTTNLHGYYPDLEYANNQAASMHNETKEVLTEIYPKLNMIKGDGDYGFINWGNMPSGSYSSKTITSAASVSWAITSDYDSYASNHCGATAVTNLALYFTKRGHSKLTVNSSKHDTFKAVYAYVGDGPKAMIAGDVVSYFSNKGYTLKHSGTSDITAAKKAIDNNRICGFLLADGLLNWHWILGVGYRTYTSSSDTYFRIVNGWENTIDKFYKPNTGSAWWSGTQYYVQ